MCEPSVQGLPNRKCFGKFAHTNLPSVILSTCTFLYSPLTLHPPYSHSPSTHSPPHTLLTPSFSHILPPLTPSSSHPPSSHPPLTPSSSHPPLTPSSSHPPSSHALPPSHTLTPDTQHYRSLWCVLWHPNRDSVITPVHQRYTISPCHVMSCDVTWCHVRSCDIMWC